MGHLKKKTVAALVAASLLSLGVAFAQDSPKAAGGPKPAAEAKSAPKTAMVKKAHAKKSKSKSKAKKHKKARTRTPKAEASTPTLPAPK